MRFTFDTNVLVYALDRGAGDRHRIALDLVRRAQGKDCVITLQALAELFRTLTGKSRMAPAEATKIVQAWRDVVPVFAADDMCLIDAMDAVSAHNWSFWDAMIWATAKRAGCRLLISEDGQDGRTLGGVTLVNPFVPDALPFADAAVRSSGLSSVKLEESITRGVRHVPEALSPRLSRPRPRRRPRLLGRSDGMPGRRSSAEWIDFDFFGHQIVAHLVTDRAEAGSDDGANPVDGHEVPVPHFGIVLTLEDWQTLADRLTAAGTKFAIEPYIRFKGQTGEQATMFFRDPSGNAIEMKAFRDLDQLFAK